MLTSFYDLGVGSIVVSYCSVCIYIYSVEMLFIICWILYRDELDSRPHIWGRHIVVSELGVIVLRIERKSKGIIIINEIKNSHRVQGRTTGCST